MLYRVGIDVGGTFTDAVLILESTGETFIAKVPSTPKDPSAGFLEALAEILATARVPPTGISYLVHGTTVATNALIEGKTPKTAFVTTRGFRDMLEIARQVRPSLYDVNFEKPAQLVPRHLCFEVPERMDASGRVVETLDEDAVRQIAAALTDDEVGSVAICFLHSYLNPEHEERTSELFRRHCPQVLISRSSTICPEFREYFRASTTVVNASVRPVVAGYVKNIERGLETQGIGAKLLIMQSNGGVLTAEQATEKPVFIIESGPAAGVIAANSIAGAAGFKDLIAFDMGGTTAKAGLVVDGRPRITKDYEVGTAARSGMGQARGSGYPIRTPVIDLVEIGAGGGSVAWVDSGGVLRVGPHSAGADPGPICYGRGGVEPTVTDANVVLGRLNPEYFLGGRMSLDLAGAAAGIREHCAKPLELDTIAAAYGIVQIANVAMVNALRIATLGRGFDPRQLVMVAFGGAGPLHANALCAELQIPVLIIPPSPGTASSLGLLSTDIRHEFSRTRAMSADRPDIDAINQIFATMEAEGGRLLALEGMAADQVLFAREIELRYVGQSYELGVACPGARLTRELVADVAERFHLEHERTYGRSAQGEPVELVNFRVTAIGAIPRPEVRRTPARARAERSVALTGTRPVFFAEVNGFTDASVYDRYSLVPGDSFLGPAVVEEMDSSSLIHPGFEVDVDISGNLLVRKCQRKSTGSSKTCLTGS